MILNTFLQKFKHCTHSDLISEGAAIFKQCWNLVQTLRISLEIKKSHSCSFVEQTKVFWGFFSLSDLNNLNLIKSLVSSDIGSHSILFHIECCFIIILAHLNIGCGSNLVATTYTGKNDGKGICSNAQSPCLLSVAFRR